MLLSMSANFNVISSHSIKMYCVCVGNYGYAFLRKFRASFRRKSSATCTSDEHYETASGFFSSQQEYDTPLTPYQVPISSIKVSSPQPQGTEIVLEATVRT